MSKYLCTFSGKYGDILWSLPTAKYISENVVSSPVDFAIMPYYVNLLPLLAAQDYIDKAFVIEDWARTHSNHGDQPWQPPHEAEKGYEKFWHLTYRGHPGISAPEMPLVVFTAYQQGINFNNWAVVPFLDVRDEDVEPLATPVHFSTGQMPDVIKEKRLVSYSFNEQYAEPKRQFFEELWKKTRDVQLEFFNVSEVGWKEATWLIKKSLVYVGDRSACWVLANGVGQQVVSFEPHPSRHASCHLGKVFGNPYGKELALAFGLPPAVAADACASTLKKMHQEVYAGMT
jgi:hypothetical protein